MDGGHLLMSRKERLRKSVEEALGSGASGLRDFCHPAQRKSGGESPPALISRLIVSHFSIGMPALPHALMPPSTLATSV